MRSSLDPTLDIIFKILFARDAAQLIALLTAVLRPPEPITKVLVRNPDVAPAQANDKNIVLDILVELKDGTLLDVEMQAQKRAAFRERTLYYWAKVYGDQLARGESYTALCPVISIIFLDYQELEGTRLHSVFKLAEIHDQQTFSDHLQIHLIELPKRADPGARQQQPDLVAWTQFLGASTDQEVQEACMSNPDVAKAQAQLSQLSTDPATVELARSRQLALDTQRIEAAANRREGFQKGLQEGLQEGTQKGRQEGLQEGTQKGLQQGKVESTSRFLLQLVEAKFGGEASRDAQTRLQGAPLEAMERWLQKALTASGYQDIFRD